eukprot:GAHX01000677.1.p1 GENE.GAHX01000677.1~~GAHX01000677.1.p1  ORF type:complete len:138 (+),score=28.35 GAHX01000677.1:36-449(+)
MEENDIKLPRDRVNNEDIPIDIDTDPEEYTQPTEEAVTLYSGENQRFNSVPFASLKPLGVTFILRSKTDHVAIFKPDCLLKEDFTQDIVVYKDEKYVGYLFEVIGKEEDPLFIVWYDKNVKDEIKEHCIFKPYIIPE